MTSNDPVYDVESRARYLAHEIAKGIIEPLDLIERLDMTVEQYRELEKTRSFRVMLDQAQAEWQSVSNTRERLKLKAAAGVEDHLHYITKAIGEEHRYELKDRIAAFLAAAKVGGVGEREAMQGNAGNGQYFKLEIHLANKKEAMVIDGGITPGVIEGAPVRVYTQSVLAGAREFEQLE